jgi:purine-binding chemotaxis protein CheW
MSKAVNTQFVTFQIGDEEYGIDIMLVQEIIRYQKLTKVFNANPAISGVMNFRGNVIPIIDMRRKFNLPEIEYDDYTVVIVIEIDKKTMGMIVDRVSDILSFDMVQIQMIDRQFEEDIMIEHLQALAKQDDRIIMLLDPSRVMSFEEYRKIKEEYTAEEVV